MKYGLARFASSLSPENMINNRNRSVDFFDKIVDGLYKGAWISSKEADDAKKHYFQFIALANSELKDELLLYDQKKIHLSHFFRKFMDGNTSYKKCLKAVKLAIAKTASKKIGALICSIYFLSPEVALCLYKSTIQEYCCLGWCS